MDYELFFIIFGIIGGLVLVGVLVFLYCKCKRKTQENDESRNLTNERHTPYTESTRSRKIQTARIDKLIRQHEHDTEQYRLGYPANLQIHLQGLADNVNSKTNLDFYTNVVPSSPNGDYIDNIHNLWRQDYHQLEVHHGFIQWLFPIREHGMNYQAMPLQLHELEKLKERPECQERLLKSYEMMLDFYGITLVDRQTGMLQRASNWQERFAHLNRSSHNYLRITRILKCLGEFGFENLKWPFIQFMLHEIIIYGTLENCFDSCIGFWIMVLRNDNEREQAIELAKVLCDRRETDYP